MKIDNLRMLSIETTRSYPVTHESHSTTKNPVENTEITEQNKKPLQKEKETAEEILNGVEKINIQLESTKRSIRFNVDESTKDIVVKIVNKDSGELIKQIPPKEALRLKERVQDMLGLIIEEMV